MPGGVAYHNVMAPTAAESKVQLAKGSAAAVTATLVPSGLSNAEPAAERDESSPTSHDSHDGGKGQDAPSVSERRPPLSSRVPASDVVEHSCALKDGKCCHAPDSPAVKWQCLAEAALVKMSVSSTGSESRNSKKRPAKKAARSKRAKQYKMKQVVHQAKMLLASKRKEMWDQHMKGGDGEAEGLWDWLMTGQQEVVHAKEAGLEQRARARARDAERHRKDGTFDLAPKKAKVGG